MILSALIIACLTATELPPTSTADAGVADVDTSLEQYRTPFDALTERALGTASRAVRFDWRRSTVGFGVSSSILAELNNFASGRVGGFARVPAGNLMVELAVTRVITWGSASSALLALTPYRQYGRPSRVELDINASYALFEGVGTGRFGFIPPTEMVFSATLGLRYLYYPGSLSNLSADRVAGALFAPVMSDPEIANMKDQLPAAMELDPSRYALLAGFTLDLFFQPGLFVTPRVLVGIPIISGPSGRGIGVWWELSLLAGWQL